MMAVAAMCKCGLAMIANAAGFAYCPHCDRDCPSARRRVKCGQCERLDKAQ